MLARVLTPVIGENDPRRKNPALAGILSAMPGLGQIYVGYYPRGFIHIMVVGILIALLNSGASRSLLAALFYGAGAALGFGLVLSLLAGLRERLAIADVPAPFRGNSIALITAGILSLAFMGFTGFARL